MNVLERLRAGQLLSKLASRRSFDDSS
jgi:hypothetical protein